ncbi:hypothetical protein [Actinotalea sp. K2]|uniref:hypothetical protein n=1 Tax=Actinotalea sp. K2 TaxID=2939438 RepID=UPI002016AB3A|nr:hypothetical protein [Actinotalea sp. K2]
MDVLARKRRLTLLRAATAVSAVGLIAYVIGVGYLSFQHDELWFKVTNILLMALTVWLIYISELIPRNPNDRSPQRPKPHKLVLLGLGILAVAQFV